MKSINDFNLKEITRDKQYHESPIDWENQIIYFLLVDRFSDGNEENYKIYNPNRDYENIYKSGNPEKWEEFSDKYNGGTIKGIESKLDYLKNLGITTIWISPIFKQPVYNENYHGYGIQNFLEIEPHFGDKDDLINLVKKAHEKDMYVILDIIINHTGDVFGYIEDSPKYTGEEYEVKGYRDKTGNPSLEFKEKIDYDIDDAVWPVELQDPKNFYKKGEIQNWDHYPEYVEGDFMSLKSINLNDIKDDKFEPSKSLIALAEVFKYWIAISDIDGYRIDTVKHLEREAVNYFTQSIHEFTKTIGKDNFYLIGEITGGMEFAYETLRKTGLNAALGINNIPNNLEEVAKGKKEPENYFNIFSNSKIIGDNEHLWYKNNVVTMFDDHDMVSHGEGIKYRFSADKECDQLLSNCLFMNVFTSGIPCIYYGTEQRFDGHGESDKYIREAMFGKNFGAFRTQNRHFFDTDNEIYKNLSNILKIRKEHLPLKQGRQFLREVTKDGEEFNIPKNVSNERILAGICWSKIFNNEEFLLGINTDNLEEKNLYVKIDQNLHCIDETFEYIYSSNSDYIGKELKVEVINGFKALNVNIPKSGSFIIHKKNYIL